MLKNYLHPLYIPLPKSLNLGLQGKTFQKLLTSPLVLKLDIITNWLRVWAPKKSYPPKKIIASFISLLLKLFVGNRRGKINAYIHMFK